MIWRIVGGIIVVGLIVTAIKLAIFLLVLWGLIFRTSVTVTILLIGGAMTLLSAHPAIGFSVIAMVGLWTLYRAMTKPKPENPVPLLPPPETAP